MMSSVSERKKERKKERKQAHRPKWHHIGQVPKLGLISYLIAVSKSPRRNLGLTTSVRNFLISIKTSATGAPFWPGGRKGNLGDKALCSYPSGKAALPGTILFVCL